ncbi:MAG: polysaccharide deacetylase family protein [Sedimentisphaerales bacterium]|nr:polysaccharide deacetylase family protein [Sedimentisphaerales bacterium]
MKVSSMSFAVFSCCIIACLAGCGPSRSRTEQPGQPVFERQEDFHWPQGKRAAISLTFDDARLSQIDRGVPMLDEYGLKGTFYVSIESLKERVEGWKKAVAAGHEIANHSVKHPCSGNFPFSRDKALEDYTLDMMRNELDEASGIIEQLLGVRPVSYAYPCGQKYVGRGMNLKSYVPLVAEKFLTGRGWLDEWANDPAYCDMAQLMGVKLDEKDFDEVKTVMDRTLANGGWLVFCSHEVAEDGRLVTSSQTLRALCEYARDPGNGIWLDTVQNIATYILKQRTEKAG